MFRRAGIANPQTTAVVAGVRSRRFGPPPATPRTSSRGNRGSATTPDDDGSILCAATTDAAAERVFWFVNGAQQGAVPEVPLGWILYRRQRGVPHGQIDRRVASSTGGVAQLMRPAGTGAVKRCGKLWWVTLHAL